MFMLHFSSFANYPVRAVVYVERTIIVVIMKRESCKAQKRSDYSYMEKTMQPN